MGNYRKLAEAPGALDGRTGLVRGTSGKPSAGISLNGSSRTINGRVYCGGSVAVSVELMEISQMKLLETLYSFLMSSFTISKSA